MSIASDVISPPSVFQKGQWILSSNDDRFPHRRGRRVIGPLRLPNRPRSGCTQNVAEPISARSVRDRDDQRSFRILFPERVLHDRTHRPRRAGRGEQDHDRQCIRIRRFSPGIQTDGNLVLVVTDPNGSTHVPFSSGTNVTPESDRGHPLYYPESAHDRVPQAGVLAVDPNDNTVPLINEADSVVAASDGVKYVTLPPNGGEVAIEREGNGHFLGRYYQISEVGEHESAAIPNPIPVTVKQFPTRVTSGWIMTMMACVSYRDTRVRNPRRAGRPC